MHRFYFPPCPIEGPIELGAKDEPDARHRRHQQQQHDDETTPAMQSGQPEAGYGGWVGLEYKPTVPFGPPEQ